MERSKRLLAPSPTSRRARQRLARDEAVRAQECRAELLAQGAKLPKGREEELKEAPPAQPPRREAQEARRKELLEQQRPVSEELHDLREQRRTMKAAMADLEERYRAKNKEWEIITERLRRVADA